MQLNTDYFGLESDEPTQIAQRLPRPSPEEVKSTVDKYTRAMQSNTWSPPDPLAIRLTHPEVRSIARGERPNPITLEPCGCLTNSTGAHRAGCTGVDEIAKNSCEIDYLLEKAYEQLVKEGYGPDDDEDEKDYDLWSLLEHEIGPELVEDGEDQGLDVIVETAKLLRDSRELRSWSYDHAISAAAAALAYVREKRPEYVDAPEFDNNFVAVTDSWDDWATDHADEVIAGIDLPYELTEFYSFDYDSYASSLENDYDLIETGNVVLIFYP